MSSSNQYLYGFPQPLTNSNSAPSISNYVVSKSSKGAYRTIQSAVNAARAARTNPMALINIYITPGTYVEDINLYDRINLVALAGDLGYVGYLSAWGPPSTLTYNQNTTVTIEGEITLATSQLAYSSYNQLLNLTLSPASGSVISFITNGNQSSGLYINGCILVCNGTGSSIFSTDGYPSIYLTNVSIFDNGTSNNLWLYSGLGKFLNLYANNTNFVINTVSPLVISTGGYNQIFLTNCNWQCLIDCTAANNNFGLTAGFTAFANTSNTYEMFKFGAQLGRLTLQSCTVTSESAPFMTGTDTTSSSYFSIYNSYIKGGGVKVFSSNSPVNVLSNTTVVCSAANFIIGNAAIELDDVTVAGNSPPASTITTSSTSANLNGEVRAGADVGGELGFTSLTNSNSTTISSGTGTVKMSSGNSANNAAWIKMYVGSTAYWVPAWTTNSP